MMRHRGLGTPVEEPEPSTMSSDPLLSSASSSASADPNTAAAPFSIPPRLPYNKQWWEEMDGFSFPLFSEEITTKPEEESHQTCETLKPSLLQFVLFGDEEGQFFRIQGYQGESDDDPDLQTFSSSSTCFSLSTRTFFSSSMKPGRCWATFPEGCKLFGGLWNFSCPTVVVTGPPAS